VPDLEVRELAGHTPLSTTTVHGRAAIVLGAIVLGFGVLTGAPVWLGEVDVNVPRPLALLVASLVPAAGAALLVHGLAGRARQQRIAARRRTAPDAPWLWDHDWNPREARRASAGSRRVLVFAAATGIVLVPLTWFALEEGAHPFLRVVTVGFYALLAVALVKGAIDAARQRAHRDTRLRLATFPYRLGETGVADLVGLPPTLASLTATLRCVEERYERDRDSQRVACYQVYADSRAFTAAELRGRRALRLTFPLPAAGPETRLRERPPTYWTLEVAGPAPGLDLAATFLLPVYAPAGAERAPDRPEPAMITVDPQGRGCLTWFVGAVFLLFAVMAGAGVWGAWNDARQRRWTPVEAFVTASRVERMDLDSDYAPVVTFRYRVGEAEHVARTVRLPRSTGSSAWASRIAGRYQPGGRYTAYVDPADPRRAVLEPGPPPSAWVFLPLFLAAAAASGWALRRLVATGSP
jgi:hypothetical protein